MSSRSASLYLLAVLLTAIWQGMIGVFVKWVPWPPIALVAMRCLIAAAALWLLVALRRKPRTLGATGAMPLRPALMGGVVLAAHWATLFWGYRVADVGPVVVAVFTHPVLTGLIEPFVHRRRPNVRQLVTALLVTAGVAHMTLPGGRVDAANLLGVLLGLGSAFLLAVRNIHARTLMARADAIELMAWQVSVAALVLLPALLWVEPSLWQGRHLLLIAVLGVAFTALPHTVVVWAFSYFSASTVAVVGSLQVVSGVLLAAALLAEEPNPGVWLGAATVVIAVAWESVISANNRA